MKKLMMLAAAMTIVGSAFAEVAAYDYKATVKNVNLKKMTIHMTTPGYGIAATVQMYIKFIESSSLYGYLISDCDYCNGAEGTGYGYLVVARKSGDGAKVPKILPADLLVKVWNPKINATSTYEAEGYLFAGKGKADWPYQAPGTWDSGIDYTYTFGSTGAGAATRFLFGTFNDSERVNVDGQIVTRFFDTWLDASGFGKAKTDSTDGGCGTGSSCTALDSLSGSVIGGLFMCFPNGYPSNYEGVLCNEWLGTTDVITGTWSIKRNTKLVPVDPTAAELVALDGYLADPIVDALVKAAGQSIKPGYSYVDTSTGTGKPNGLVNIEFANAFGL